MNILLVHNTYQFAGGEDVVFATMRRVLADLGHRVLTYERDNKDIDKINRIALAAKTLWNGDAASDIERLCRREAIAVAIFHNTFPLISPASYSGARRAGAKVVQWLHNFRPICPAATLYRNGHVCEDCIGKAFPLDALVHRCYRDSLQASAVAGAMVGYHRWRATWHTDVDRFVALSAFSRQKFVEAGFVKAQISIAGNFLADDPGAGSGDGGYALYVGRLTREKGVLTLLAAWSEIGNLRLKIVGDGPLRETISDDAGRDARIEYVGQLDHRATLDLMRRARFLVMPSEWYEPGLPLVCMEALAVGTPVLAADLGCVREHVRPGDTGRLFRPCDPHDLATSIIDLNEACETLRPASRAEYLAHFTAEQGAARYAELLRSV